MVDMLSKKQVARLIGVSERTVSRHDVEWGLNPVQITNRLTQYHPDDVSAYLARIGKKDQIMTPTEAEKIVRSVLSGYHFDEDTAESLTKVADLLATLRA